MVKKERRVHIGEGGGEEMNLVTAGDKGLERYFHKEGDREFRLALSVIEQPLLLLLR